MQKLSWFEWLRLRVASWILGKKLWQEFAESELQQAKRGDYY